MDKEISIKDRLKLLPPLPGVYLMKDKSGEIIYIGKAKKLDRRVKSYFTKTLDTPKLRTLVPKIVKFDFIITDNEIEALILESQLIKKHQPKYNILLKDDKKFPWFVITDEEYPQILITRRNKDAPKRGRYFGPYTNSGAMYSTLEHIKRLFPLKQCRTPQFKDRPCLYYQMGKCLAPCQKMVTSEDYKKIVEQVALFLSGKQGELVEELKKQMEICAEKQQFERAAKFRDSYFNIKQSMEHQKVVDENLSANQDLIGFIEDELRFVAVLIEIRDGRMLDKKNFELSKNENDSQNEAILSFIKNYYLLKTDDFPKEILIPIEADTNETVLIEQWLSQKRGTKVVITMPKLGKKKELSELAQKNADAYLSELKLKDLTQIQADWNEVGSYIKEKLFMKKFPHRVECFDISHSQGTNTVASMVVFIDGKPSKKDYRKFKIKSTEGKPDDFLSMKEVISRRYKDKENMPDLIIVDGGKGQLSSACKILKELDIKEQAICGLAKRLEEVFLPKKSLPIIFPSTSPALYFFQRIRDEAHRFAITFHRSLREKNALVSMLDDVKYIGKERKKLLYEKFKDIDGIKKAKRKELEELLGKKAAKSLWDKLRHDL